MRPRRLAMVWPYLAAYRYPFCDAAHARLAEEGIEFELWTGEPSAAQDRRRDRVDAAWLRVLPERRLPLANRELLLRRLPTGVDLLVVEQAVKNLESYPALLRQNVGGPGVAVWGHGRSFSTPQGKTLAALKQSMTRMAQWAFIYTQEGADYIVDRGFPRGRLTVLNNTLDTRALSADIDAVTDDEVASFHEVHATIPGRTALFLGAVDAIKGVEYLLNAMQATTDVTLVVGGAGPAEALLRSAQAAGSPVRVLGRLDGHDKAVALRAASLMASPASVGLVAVDSLVSGVPILTRRNALHGPEAGYLRDGTNSLWLPRSTSAAEYGAAMMRLLADRPLLAELAAQCKRDAEGYELPLMVERFVAGVVAWSTSR